MMFHENINCNFRLFTGNVTASNKNIKVIIINPYPFTNNQSDYPMYEFVTGLSINIWC